MQHLKRRFLCLLLAMVMVFSTGCSNISARAISDDPVAASEEESSEEEGTSEEEEFSEKEESFEEETVEEESSEEEVSEDEVSEEEVSEEEIDEEETDEDGTQAFFLEGEDSEPVYLMSADDFSEGGVEKQLDGMKTLFIDKYVNPIDSTGIPNQFELTLEAGVEDGEKKMIELTPAPDEHYTAFLIDQSFENLTNDRLASVNKCLETYFNAMKTENLARLQRASDGLYSDIDPNGNINAQMENHLLKAILVVGYNQESATRFKNFNGLAPLTDGNVNYLLEHSQIVSQTFIDPYDETSLKAGKLYNDNRAGSAMIHTYNELAELEDYKKSKTNLVILTDWNFHDFKANKQYNEEVKKYYNSNPSIYPDPGNDSNVFSLAYNTNMYIFGSLGGDLGATRVTEDGNTVAVTYREFIHITWSANQANFLMDYARKTKDMGIKINSIIVNDIWQKDMIDNAFTSGRIETLDADWYGGIIGIMASGVSSDYPRNSHLLTTASWIPNGYNFQLEVRNPDGSFNDWTGFDEPYDFMDPPFSIGQFYGGGDRVSAFKNMLQRFKQWQGNHAGIDDFRLYFDIERQDWVAYQNNDKRYRFFDYDKGLEPNRFGVYSKYPADIMECVPAMEEVVKQTGGGAADGGYATSSSALQDVVSGPFSIPGGSSDVRVYKVPRIPSDLDADGVPESMDEDGRSLYFTWGEEYYTDSDDTDAKLLSDWVDITDQVSVSVAGKSVRISGFDYETNALTDYNKRGVDSYKPGDYGWKLVVRIGITADETFGGNGIRTNDPDSSGFLPSLPGSDSGLPRWAENEELNPDGDSFVEMFPLPVVDLQPTHPYSIITQDIYVYAPQTAPAINLVMDDTKNIFYNDPYYAVLKVDADKILDEYDDIQKELSDFVNEHEGEILSDDDTMKQIEMQNKASELYSQYKDILSQMSECVLSTPDGKNNQFVDIFYTLNDPDGLRIGTMYVPHGKAYVNGNITWDFSAMGGDTKLTKSGIYTVSAEVTPVYTAGSPNGLIYTEANKASMSDSELENALGVSPAYLYFSEDYSMTGSVSQGEFEGSTMTGESSAYLYQLHIAAEDTKLLPKQTIDFNIGNEALDSTDNVHIMSWKWVCTDGVTASITANEPGKNGLLNVGTGGVQMTNTLPDTLFEEGRVATIMNMIACGDGTGFYIPVTTTLRRSCGVLDKSLSETDQVAQTVRYLSDSDDVFGPGVSSVVWEHECSIIEDENEILNDAASYGDSDDGKGKNGMVRYLIHVDDNPKPTIEKTTPKSIISRGEVMKWEITAANNTEEENPNHLQSEFSLIDVAPFVGDARIDPMTNIEGSIIHGNVYFEGVTVDITASDMTADLYSKGKIKILYTTDVNVRDASEAQLIGIDRDGNINWKEAELTASEGILSSLTLPANVTAVRFDTTLDWNEQIKMTVMANVDDIDAQVNGDRYHNQAGVYDINGGRLSEVSAIVLSPASISGKVWVDENPDGLIGADEDGIKGVTVTLYQEWSSKNGKNPVDRVIDGVKLTRVYDKDYNPLPDLLTDASGNYLFEEVNPGTYYIVADTIPDKYNPAKKHAGAGDVNMAESDSECEETFGTNTDARYDKTAWIKKVEVNGSSVTGQNFGMQNIRGTVKISKFLDEIYYPSGMTDEEKEDYQLVFLFQLRNKDTGDIYKRTVRIDGKNLDKGTSSCTFTELPLGTYELTELKAAQYTLDRFEAVKGASNVSKTSNTAWEVRVTPTVHEFEINAYNRLDKEPPGGDENGIHNLIKVRVPVSLDVIYMGTDPVGDRSITQYTFTAADFDPAKGGDMFVTYDDGTTASISAGTLRFEDVTLTPATVTNMMNTADGKKLLVTAYYSEKGRTVTDTFRVGVNLKPVHKFKLTFDANGSTFDDGSTKNVVNFAYDDNKGYNIVTGGTYKDVPNGGLNQYISSSYGFAGWNTKYDGTGINYTDLTALDAIGRDPTISTLTLYAQWTCSITFDPQGGTLAAAPGLTSANLTAGERAVLGKGTSTITYNVNQSISTGLAATKTNYNFVLWNTKPDGTGTDITNYGKCTGPVTFYAIYYQSDFYYTGAPQTFTAPVDGWYRFTLYGADGGYGNNMVAKAGYGGKVAGTIWLQQGQGFYVYVGQTAPNTISHLWTWNGGAPSPSGSDAGHWGGAGGGATDIRLIGGSWNNAASLRSRIAVAGGGGGAGSTCSGGNGVVPDGGNAGGLVSETIYNKGYPANDGGSGSIDLGGNYTTGAGQTYGGAGHAHNNIQATGTFGKGATASTCCSGGGGGWYGGGTCYVNGGSGGSSYLLGWPGCDTTYAAYQRSLAGYDLTFKDALFQGGGEWNRAEKTWGESGGAAFLQLIERTY